MLPEFASVCSIKDETPEGRSSVELVEEVGVTVEAATSI